ncbi:hypothetical protein AAKU52_000013 [Pedobacter sp. CG_S7]|uniref:RagB/SusD family nutrient uptake outer membrane protein n=1 Tax=Pedobacter sp. CG_S7 TaxID=3143930 RepID=UPI0033952A8C
MKIILKRSCLFLIIGTLVFLFPGCKKFLDETDASNFTVENYFTKPEHAQSVVNSIYDNLKSTQGGGFGGAPWMMLEFSTGLANTELGQAVNSIFVRNLVNTSDNTYGQTYWVSHYRGIANANLAIAKIPGISMDEALKKRTLGEAHFLRAWYYFNLVQIFGHIPLIVDPVGLTSEKLYPNQVPAAEVYDLIVADLIAAESSGLPWTNKNGRVNLGAIKSLLSTVYLTMAGYPLQKGAEYYNLSAVKAAEVIASGQFKLFDSYNDLHNPDKKNMEENIFMVQFAAFIQPSSLQVAIIPYNQGISAYSDETGGISVMPEFVRSYEAGDLRVKEKEFYYSSYTLRADRTKTKDLGGFYIYKHFDVLAQTSTTSSNLNWALIRYAQVLLDFAEASNEANGPTSEAYNAVNKIRSRAALPDLAGLSKAQLREAIWRERFYELSFENKTWFDMVRIRKGFNVATKQFDNYVGYKFSYGPIVSERELLFPIPTSEVRNNKNITQNPGY